MQVSKTLVLIGFVAAAISGCAEDPKTKFAKGKDNSEQWHKAEVCSTDAVKYCGFTGAAKPQPNQPNVDADEKTQPSDLIDDSPVASKVEIDAAKRSANQGAYGEGYEVLTQPVVSFKEKDKTRINLNFEIDSKISSNEEETVDTKQVLRFVAKVCLDRIQKKFNDSYKGLNLRIGFEKPASPTPLTSTEMNPMATPTPLSLGNKETALTIKLIEPRVKAENETQGRLVMEQFPFHSDLFPFETDADKCKADASCLAKNDGFCRSLAKMVGHGLGLHDEVAKANKCSEENVKVPDALIALMKAGTASVGHLPGDDTFWERPFLNVERDKQQINRLRCTTAAERAARDRNTQKNNKKSKDKRNKKTPGADSPTMMSPDAQQDAQPVESES